MLPDQPLPRAPVPKRVIVVGAGLAGLTCAYELARAGHHVTVLEARDRPGGRVWTLREPLPAGLLAEVGATFLPDNHPLPLHYAATFGLELLPLPTTGPPPRYRIDGVMLFQGPASPDAEAMLLPSGEPGPNPLALLTRSITALAERLGGWPPAGGSPGDAWAPLDRLSLADLLRREGLPDGARALAGLTLLGNFGEGIETISALAAARQLALQRGRARSFVIAGGNDRLARALAAHLGDRVRYHSEVLGLTQDRRGVVARVRGPAGETDVPADRVILAVPTPTLARLAVSPAWSQARAAALRQQGRWTPVTRIVLTVRRRFWAGGQPVLLASSDRPTVRWIVGPHPAPGEQDVLTAYVMGAQARVLASLSPEGRAAWARAEAAHVFPEWGGVAESEAWSHCWDRDPSAGGGYPWPAPGDDFLPETLSAPEGRVHFAGEQTTSLASRPRTLAAGFRARCRADCARRVRSTTRCRK